MHVQGQSMKWEEPRKRKKRKRKRNEERKDLNGKKRLKCWAQKKSAKFTMKESCNVSTESRADSNFRSWLMCRPSPKSMDFVFVAVFKWKLLMLLMPWASNRWIKLRLFIPFVRFATTDLLLVNGKGRTESKPEKQNKPTKKQNVAKRRKAKINELFECVVTVLRVIPAAMLFFFLHFSISNERWPKVKKSSSRVKRNFQIVS